MNKNKQKLELTWIGKDREINLEPRILKEIPEKSYGDKNTENMLIHGDNLLALKALEQDYTGKIKCIYIDPPYNTGSAFEHYDDNVEHSIWINLMYKRISVLKTLLSEDGILAIEIDDNEMPYLRVILDEIFTRNKFVAQINVKSNSISGAKTAHKTKTILRNKDNIIIYKNSDNIIVNPQYVKKEEWDTHYNYYLTFDEQGNPDKLLKLKDVLEKQGIINKNTKITKTIIEDKNFYEFIIEHRKNIFRLVNSISIEAKTKSLTQLDTIINYYDENGNLRFAYNGSRISFLDSSIISIDGRLVFAQLLGDFWNDIDFQNTQNEGGVSFPNNKKPEALIRRIFNLFTEEGDIVLDSFLGSGTTAAVAHKMGRKWIGIELGDHCYTHCEPRLHQVVDGTDQGGISKAVNWKGGGGYKFYELAPSLLKKDEFDNWIIDPRYDAEMLAEAMAKHEGYKFSPSEKNVYKQGFSTEKDFIFTTTQFLSHDLLNQIHNKLEDNESLLICATHFEEGVGSAYSNITVKKIPQMLLSRCEFGKLEYNLNVIEETPSEVFEDEEKSEDNV